MTDPITRLLAEVEAWDAFYTDASTEVVLAEYLDTIGVDR